MCIRRAVTKGVVVFCSSLCLLDQPRSWECVNIHVMDAGAVCLLSPFCRTSVCLSGISSSRFHKWTDSVPTGNATFTPEGFTSLQTAIISSEVTQNKVIAYSRPLHTFSTYSIPSGACISPTECTLNLNHTRLLASDLWYTSIVYKAAVRLFSIRRN